MDITPRRNKKRRLRDWSSARDRRGKERRVSPSVYGDGDTCDSTAPEESSGSEDEVKQLVKVQESSRTLHHVRPTELTYPRSTYDNYDPPLPRSREAFALRELLEEWHCQPEHTGEDKPDWIIMDLDQFVVYRPPPPSQSLRDEIRPGKSTRAAEMEPLHFLTTETGISRLVFNGILRVGDQQFYVEDVPFEVLSIEGYGNDDMDSTTIYIQSRVGAQEEVWYRLQEPGQEYQRYYEPFSWVSNLARYFIDYLEAHENVQMSNFRQDFYDWTKSQKGHTQFFQDWKSQHPSMDFRVAINAYVEFLWKEAYSLDDETGGGPTGHPLWGQIRPHELTAVPMQTKSMPKLQKTIVTPMVANVFKDMYFAEKLQEQAPEAMVLEAQDLRKRQLGFLDCFPVPKRNDPVQHTPPARFQPGDFVGIPRDEVSKWRDTAQTWYAYVQGVDERTRKLSLIWLYRPEDTTLGNMHYPFKNELFFSNHCNCGDAPTRFEDVACTVRVELLPKSMRTNADFIVRQTYIEHEQAFVTFRNQHLHCDCDKRKTSFEEVTEKYKAGDTVLVKQPGSRLLEPFVITSFAQDQLVTVRRLLRLRRDLEVQSARANELVWTDDLIDISAKRVERRCQVRFISRKQVLNDVPTPYDRQGSGDLFYICSRLVDGRAADFEDFPSSMNEGYDFLAEPPFKKLSGLDLFSGFGNLGRGIEEGGAVDNRWAVDLFPEAMHSYAVNDHDIASKKLFLGSVDDFFGQALAGVDSEHIPKVGEVEHTASGNPCTAFSKMQPDQLSDSSIKAASLVASVASHFDLFRPQYGILENVPEMAANWGVNKNGNIFSQLLCAFVAMGYQVRQFTMDAWAFGNTQSRTRLIISLTAPGLTPLARPTPSHSHPNYLGSYMTALGKLINDQRFGERSLEPAAFAFATAEEAVKDLPYIGDSRVNTCIPFPDHRICLYTQTYFSRLILQNVPIYPTGMSLFESIQNHRIPDGLLEKLPEKIREKPNRAYTRVLPNGRFPTVMTRPNPADGRAQAGVHWSEHRSLSVMEMRRAQGIPDYEVLVGSPSTQWKQVGNGVARGVSLALGLSLREACLANTYKNRPSPTDYIHSVALAEDVVESSDELNEEPTQESVTISRSTTVRRNSRVTKTPLSETIRDVWTIEDRTTIDRRRTLPSTAPSDIADNVTARPKPVKRRSEVNSDSRASPGTQLEPAAPPSKDRRSRSSAAELRHGPSQPDKRATRRDSGQLVAPNDFSRIPEKMARKTGSRSMPIDLT